MAGFPQLYQSLTGVDIVTSHVPLFWISVFFSALGFLFLLPLKEVQSTPNKEKIERGKSTKVGSWNTIVKFSFIRSTSGLGWGLIDSLLPLYFFIRFQVGSDILGPIYALSRILSIFTYLLIPIALTKYHEVTILTWSRVFSALIAIVFSFVNWFLLAAFLLILFRLILMFSMPVRQTIATGIVDPEETATAIGVSGFARMGLRSIAPTAAGFMFEAISLSLPMLMGAGLLLFNGYLYYRYFRETFTRKIK